MAAASMSSTGSATTLGAVAARAGQLGQAGQHVDLGQHRGGGLQPGRGGGHQLAQLDEQIELQFLGLLFGRQDFLFVLLQLGRDVRARRS